MKNIFVKYTDVLSKMQEYLFIRDPTSGLKFSVHSKGLPYF